MSAALAAVAFSLAAAGQQQGDCAVYKTALDFSTPVLRQARSAHHPSKPSALRTDGCPGLVVSARTG